MNYCRLIERNFILPLKVTLGIYNDIGNNRTSSFQKESSFIMASN